VSTPETEPAKYWGFLCTTCHQPIHIVPYVEGKYWRSVKGAIFTLICDECQSVGEYPLKDMKVISANDVV